MVWRRKRDGQPGAQVRIHVPSFRESGAVRLVEFLGAVATLILFVYAVVRLDGPIWSTVLVIWFALLATTAMVVAAWFETRRVHRVRYAAMLPSAHQVNHRLRDASSAILLRNSPLAETLPMLVEALTSIAQVFTGVTGSPCRACIKTVQWPADATPVVDHADIHNLQVSTMCRDAATGAKPRDRFASFVDQNEHFEVLFLQREKYRWFWCNNLAKHPHRNPHWTPDGPNDYMSTCVWPIQKEDITPDKCHDTLAFLCIDSMSTGIFDPRFDFWVGAAFADALYSPLKLLRIQKARPTLFTPPVQPTADAPF
jgi:hypothetical protein